MPELSLPQSSDREARIRANLEKNAELEAKIMFSSSGTKHLTLPARRESPVAIVTVPVLPADVAPDARRRTPLASVAALDSSDVLPARVVSLAPDLRQSIPLALGAVVAPVLRRNGVPLVPPEFPLRAHTVLEFAALPVARSTVPVTAPMRGALHPTIPQKAGGSSGLQAPTRLELAASFPKRSRERLQLHEIRARCS